MRIGRNLLLIARPRGLGPLTVPPVEDMSIEHRGLDVGMAQEFLNRADVIAGFER
jgi:hypothetical protein